MTDTRLPEGFLWGGATADFQYEGGFNEGGRGILSHDYETDGSIENPRHHTFRMPDGSILRTNEDTAFDMASCTKIATATQILLRIAGMTSISLSVPI